MSFYDYGIGLAEAAIDAALARKEKVQRSPSQFTRQGKTTSWFEPRYETLAGERTVYRAFVKGYRGARATSYNTAATTEGPMPMKIGHVELSFSWADLCMIRGTVRWSMLQETKHKKLEYAVYDLVEKLYTEVNSDIVERLNTGIMLPYHAGMAQIHTLYDLKGANGGSVTITGHNALYARIKNGPISRFQVGDVLSVHADDASSSDDAYLSYVYVHAVIHGEDGPVYLASSVKTRVADIGPGLILEPCDADGTTTGNTTAWNSGTASAATDFADCWLSRSGEFKRNVTTESNNIHGIPDFFDPAISVFNNASGTALDRADADGTAYAYEWQNPMVITPTDASAGSEVELVVDDHFTELANNWIYEVQAGRAKRRSHGRGLPGGKNNEIAISENLTFFCTPPMGNHIVQSAADTAQFTHASMLNDAAAQRLKRIGVEGFDGYVWHNMALGEIAIRTDANCKPFHGFLIEPSSFFWIGPKGGQSVQWLPHGNGGRIWPIAGTPGVETNGTPTFERQAMAFTMFGLMCDQPQANAMIEHIKTSGNKG